MGTPIIRVGETPQTSLGVEIKIKSKDIISTDLGVTRKGIKGKCKGSNLKHNMEI